MMTDSAKSKPIRKDFGRRTNLTGWDPDGTRPARNKKFPVKITVSLPFTVASQHG